MRYDDWDVILFPRDSHVPIQEFKTACFVSQADYGRSLPTLTCFISSLPPSMPFRISLHSWRTGLKATALLESQRKGSQKIVFVVQVIIGETRVFHGSFDLTSKWPQEITHEKRSLTSNDIPSSQRRRPLEFPPFHTLTLMNNTWDARDPYGRIRVVLSEQLVNKTPSPGNLDLGPANELVCFSFQHAPKDILQQAGISWPIQNPLYLPDTFTRNNQCHQPALAASWTPHALSSLEKPHIQTPPSQNAQSIFGGPHEAELKQYPNACLPRIPPFTKQPVSSKIRACHASAWDDSFISLDHGADDFSMDNWSTKGRPSASYDYSTPSYVSTSHSSANVPSWIGNMSQYSRNKSDEWNDHPANQEKQVVVTLRDDQLGQIIDALSPSKHNVQTSRTPSALYHEHGQEACHNFFPSKFTAAPLINHPSSGFLACKPSYSDSNKVLRNISNKLSSQKHYLQDQNKNATPTMHRPYILARNEDIDPSQLRLQTPSPPRTIIPTPNPFIQRQPTAVPDPSIRGWSSAHSSTRHVNRTAQEPSGSNSRTRKENPASNSPQVSDHTACHYRNPTRAASPVSRARQPTTSFKAPKPFTPHNRSTTISDLVEIIDIDAISPDQITTTNPTAAADAAAAATTTAPSPFKPTHKPAGSLSSTDSTLRLERQLFSALGEELGSFNQHIDAAEIMGPELAQALGGGGGVAMHSEMSGTGVLDASASDGEAGGKRKRGGTLGGGGSPLSKRERAGEVGLGGGYG